MQSFWPPLVSSVALRQGAQGARAPDPAPEGTAGIWQICEVYLRKTACKAQWHDSYSISYHAGSPASHPLAWAASMWMCRVHAEQTLLLLPPLQEGKEAWPEKAPSLPPSFPLCIMSLQGGFQSGPIDFCLVTSVFL